MRLAISANMDQSEGYCHQKGIFPAREAVVMDAQIKGIGGVSVEDVFMGNGVSELILLAMEALLDPGDEVLVPAPDYPLWSAAVSLTGATPVFYPCSRQNDFLPDPSQIARLVTARTKALVVINPNNPTGAVYPREILERMAQVAEENRLVVFSDEIYDRVLYDGARHVPMATLCSGTLCGTFGGLSKVYRACGVRTGWLFFSGKRDHASEYLLALELLASLRLCSNVLGQWAVQTALGGRQSIYELTSRSGRLGRQRQAVIDAVARSKYLDLVVPNGALYAFPSVDKGILPDFDDRRFAMALLEEKHVLVVPGGSFHIDDNDHFRITLLPDEDTMTAVFARIEALLDSWSTAGASPD